MKKTIHVIGACRGCGATFIAASLAFTMARSIDGVTYLEGRRRKDDTAAASVFHEMNIDRHMRGRIFADFFELKKEGEKTLNRVNLHANVNWAVRMPKTEMRPASERPIGSGAHLTKQTPHGRELFPLDVAGSYIIWDSNISTRRLTGMAEMSFAEMNFKALGDIVLFVVDTLP